MLADNAAPVTAAAETSPAVSDAPAASTSSTAVSESAAPAVEGPLSLAAELKKASAANAGSPAQDAAVRALSEQERKAALKQAHGELDRKYGDLLKADPKALREAIAFAQRISHPHTRTQFIAEVVGELMQDPTQAPLLRSILAPFAGQPAAPAVSPAPDIEPQIYVKGADGQLYIDPDKYAEREQWRDRKLREDWQKDMAPLKQTADELRLERDAVKLDKQVTDWSGNIHGYLKSLPDYEANQSEIAAAFTHDCDALLARNPEATAHEIENVAIKAYNRVTAPKVTQAAEARVQADLRAKQQGRTASPNAPGRTTVQRDDKPLDLATELKAEAQRRGLSGKDLR